MKVILLEDEQADRLFHILRNTSGGHGDLCDAVEGADEIDSPLAVIEQEADEL